jgi:hypothetical protein
MQKYVILSSKVFRTLSKNVQLCFGQRADFQNIRKNGLDLKVSEWLKKSIKKRSFAPNL